MTDLAQDTRDGYWYAGEDAARGRRVLEAMRVYRAADMAMRRRTRDDMAMGDNELLALRFILRAERQGVAVSPSDVARYLGISTASTTALVDRLVRSDHVSRAPHPSDRRMVVLHATPHTDDEVRKTLGAMHERMMDATRGLSDDDADVIISFLEHMTKAIDQISPEA
ncbi:MarR family winged helix-turn-helix transcriptional regulator [Microbacterium sp. C7(2022)]|uniref:MarR family winged helix-turn-helix transcriptional regulator n=1 Tax=Microbacterium sp. C7(2022) TaxID=2992759 RepID=UPI00237AD1BB|nr:MarR family transcriptional regulator [Microbacterium sp. C7(2022)]MDE0546523.1 MarR family transcriptional regulator [Microbacterium sp. C7(2022)]